MLKKLAIATTISASLLALSACGGDSEKVVETDAGNITKEDFYDAMKDKVGEQVLYQLVTSKVLEENYEVSDEEVDKEVNQAKEQLGDQFEMALQQQGIKDEEAFREAMRSSLLQEKAASEGVEVTDKEMKERFDRMKTEIEAQHILVDDEETAKEVEKKLDDGESFKDLAKEYSQDQENAKDAGKLGYFSAGDMDPEFEEAAYKLDEGEVSEPVMSQFGFHIIKVTDKREKEEDIGSFEDNKDNIRREILNEKINPAEAQQRIDELMQEADIKVNIDDDEYKDMFNTEEAQDDKSEDEDKDKKDEE